MGDGDMELEPQRETRPQASVCVAVGKGRRPASRRPAHPRSRRAACRHVAVRGRPSRSKRISGSQPEVAEEHARHVVVIVLPVHAAAHPRRRRCGRPSCELIALMNCGRAPMTVRIFKPADFLWVRRCRLQCFEMPQAPLEDGIAPPGVSSKTLAAVAFIIRNRSRLRRYLLQRSHLVRIQERVQIPRSPCRQAGPLTSPSVLGKHRIREILHTRTGIDM